jgi:hypothetical protein
VLAGDSSTRKRAGFAESDAFTDIHSNAHPYAGGGICVDSAGTNGFGHTREHGFSCP